MAEVPTITVIDPADPAGEAIMVINKSDYDPKKYRLPGSPMPKLRRGLGSEVVPPAPPAASAAVPVPTPAPAKGNSIAAYDEPPPAAAGKK